MTIVSTNTKDGRIHIKRKFTLLPKVFIMDKQKVIVFAGSYYEVYKHIGGRKHTIAEAHSLEVAKATKKAWSTYEGLETLYEMDGDE